MRRIDLTNKRVGMLTAKEPSHTNAHGDVIWKCQCDCGNICYVAASSLRHSRTKSCGCMRKEWIAKKLKRYNEYVHYDNYVMGITAKGETFLIDTDDYKKVKGISWHSDGKGHICGFIGKKQVFMHRVIMDALDNELLIDHINHCGTDNRKENLRLVTSAQNNMNHNPQKNTESGRVGVTWSRDKSKWRATIGCNGKNVALGYYKNLNDAIEARIKAEKDYFKEYAPYQEGEVKED